MIVARLSAVPFASYHGRRTNSLRMPSKGGGRRCRKATGCENSVYRRLQSCVRRQIHFLDTNLALPESIHLSPLRQLRLTHKPTRCKRMGVLFFRERYCPRLRCLLPPTKHMRRIRRPPLPRGLGTMTPRKGQFGVRHLQGRCGRPSQRLPGTPSHRRGRTRVPTLNHWVHRRPPWSRRPKWRYKTCTAQMLFRR